ncbi:hypothetical protein SDC9_98541 [bioreactor metagenome]|uniref:Uncharacterized protein n=1 Tax=bioreactor metagenome TaxID=1076179 RepID=A0A645AF47_9ZZZZ
MLAQKFQKTVVLFFGNHFRVTEDQQLNGLPFQAVRQMYKPVRRESKSGTFVKLEPPYGQLIYQRIYFENDGVVGIAQITKQLRPKTVSA